MKKARAHHDTLSSPPSIRRDDETVLVIVPAHNEGAQIETTLRSLQGQTRPPEHIVVAADNCTDDTAELARGLGVTVLETRGNTQRKAGAMNQAWAAYGHRGTVIITIDADTVLAHDAVEQFVNALSKRVNHDVGAMCARYWAKESTGLAWRLQRLEYARYDDTREMRAWVVQVASGAAAIYRARVLDDVVRSFDREGPWDGRSLIEDYGLTLDIKTLGYRVAASSRTHVLTDTPQSFGDLWHQRQRWGRGGIDECRKRGWTPATRRDIAAYWLFGVSSLMRFVWVGYVIALFSLGLGFAFTALGMVPMLLMWIDRVTSAWRVPGRTWHDVGISALLFIEDLYGIFLEACTAVALVRSLRRVEQAW